MTEKKLFLTSFPHGALKVVEVIEPRKDMKGCFYIRYQSGGTDTTSHEFLFDIPEGVCFADCNS